MNAAFLNLATAFSPKRLRGKRNGKGLASTILTVRRVRSLRVAGRDLVFIRGFVGPSVRSLGYEKSVEKYEFQSSANVKSNIRANARYASDLEK